MSPSQQETLRERFEEKKAEFLVFDPASGSRWLRDDIILSFLSEEIERAREELKKKVEGMILLDEQGDRNTRNEKYNQALDKVLALLSKETK